MITSRLTLHDTLFSTKILIEKKKLNQFLREQY